MIFEAEKWDAVFGGKSLIADFELKLEPAALTELLTAAELELTERALLLEPTLWPKLGLGPALLKVLVENGIQQCHVILEPGAFPKLDLLDALSSWHQAGIQITGLNTQGAVVPLDFPSNHWALRLLRALRREWTVTRCMYGPYEYGRKVSPHSG